MNTHAETICIAERTAGSMLPASIDTGIKLTSQWFIDLSEPILEYCLGTHVGAALGWLGGWCMGATFTRYFRPSRFSDLNQLTQWHIMPQTFAQNGILLGVIAGVIVIAVMMHKTNNKVADLYNHDITDTTELAQTVGISNTRTRRILDRLTRHGKITDPYQ